MSGEKRVNDWGAEKGGRKGVERGGMWGVKGRRGGRS